MGEREGGLLLLLLLLLPLVLLLLLLNECEFLKGSLHAEIT